MGIEGEGRTDVPAQQKDFKGTLQYQSLYRPPPPRAQEILLHTVICVLRLLVKQWAFRFVKTACMYTVCLCHGSFYTAHLSEQHNNWKMIPCGTV